jgi:hypothetical protein
MTPQPEPPRQSFHHPPLSPARWPVTASVLLLAAAASVAWWCSWIDPDPLRMGARWPSEPWRPFTAPLLHTRPWHLLLDLVPLWYFGAAIESAYGSGRYALLLAALALGSGAALHALAAGGFGLSGADAGLNGFALVAVTRTARAGRRRGAGRGTAGGVSCVRYHRRAPRACCEARVRTREVPVTSGHATVRDPGAAWTVTRIGMPDNELRRRDRCDQETPGRPRLWRVAAVNGDTRKAGGEIPVAAANGHIGHGVGSGLPGSSYA